MPKETETAPEDRDSILEEAAKVADAEAEAFHDEEGEVYIARTIANKIRALKTVPAASEKE